MCKKLTGACSNSLSAIKPWGDSRFAHRGCSVCLSGEKSADLFGRVLGRLIEIIGNVENRLCLFS
jgi:hypothetical protein